MQALHWFSSFEHVSWFGPQTSFPRVWGPSHGLHEERSNCSHAGSSQVSPKNK